MNVLELLLCLPAVVVGANVFPLLFGCDVVRLDSAHQSHRSRKALKKVYDKCAPVSLQLDAKDGFELEHAAWEWFWKRSMPLIPSPNQRSFNEVAKMIGNENLVHGDIHLASCGEVDSVATDRVLGVPALVQKVSQLSVSIQSAQDVVVQNLQLFTSLSSLSVKTRGAATEEVLLALLRGAAPLKDLTLNAVVRVTDTVLEALMRHAPTMESARHNPEASTSLNLYNFYAQCKNLHTLSLYGEFDLETCMSIPIPATCVVAIATGCPRLKTVWLGGLEPGFDALTVFASHCPELQSLDGMRSLRLTNAGLAALTNNCANFSTLQSTSWEVTDGLVVHAAQPVLSRLQHVALLGGKKSAHSDSHSRALLTAIAYMHNVQTFSLDEADAEVRLQALLALNSSRLHSVSITSEDDRCDPALGGAEVARVMAVVTRNPLLQELRMSGNSWLSDDVLEAIAASCPLLRELYARSSAASTLTDAAVVALVQGCPKLSVMEGLSGPALTDASVMALAEHCSDLYIVNLLHSPQVTETALTALVQKCPGLEVLHVCGSSIDAAAVFRLRREVVVKDLDNVVVSVPGRMDWE
jgi:hypothetical protein